MTTHHPGPAIGTGSAPKVSVHRWRGEAALTLAVGTLQATYLPEFGMVGVSLQHAGREILALPGGLAAYRRGHVTGLPLLAPWANRLAERSYRVADVAVDLEGIDLNLDDFGLPIHGTMTAQPGWEIVGAGTERDAARLHARFDFGDRPDLLDSFPFPHQLDIEVRVSGGELQVATTLRPSGSRAVPASFGYHPYLRLPGCPRRTWHLGFPSRRHLALDGRGLPTGEAHDEPAERAAIGSRTFDDLYMLGSDRAFTLESESEHVTVRFGSEYPFAQVYAPPGQAFVCIEPMTAPTNALLTGECPMIAPGDSFRAGFTISVSGRE